MSTPPDRRHLRRLATRERISDIATRLFTERGFDRVTVDDVAEAAGVGRMTVFNHFPRKEDMFFDRDDEIRQVIRDTVEYGAPGQSPIEALRLLAHRLVRENSPYVEFSAASQGFVGTIEGSETLKARARALRDEIAQECAAALARHAGQPADHPVSQLAAAMLLATWTTAAIKGHQRFRDDGDEQAAARAFLALVDLGSAGISAIVTGANIA